MATESKDCPKCGTRIHVDETCPRCAIKPFAAPHGSAWQQVNAIFAEADKIEELIKLRMEKPGETRETAHQWAMEQYRRYATPNTDYATGVAYPDRK